MIQIRHYIAQLDWRKPISITPLVTFRILLGLVLCVTHIRFWANGWIETLFIEPNFFFHYQGFNWIPHPSEQVVYWIFAGLIVSSLFIALGFLYRISVGVFVVLFTYTELLDATNYLNHHYLVVLFGILLLLAPANRFFSVDALLRPRIVRKTMPAYFKYIIFAQISTVYFFAGLAKVNYGWLFQAMPLRVWLPEHQDLVLIGPLLAFPITAYVFSWFGALYDLTIWFWLLNKRTRAVAYGTVVLFHVMTGILFNIGIFPILMITSNLIFFHEKWHDKLYEKLGYSPADESTFKQHWLMVRPFVIAYFVLQFALPFRHVLYPGNVLVTEEGYRFSWRVMLLEKSGLATFYVHDPKTGRSLEVQNDQYLTSFQEKQMSIQPDFMLQYAHFLAEQYKSQIENPKVTVSSYVSMNGQPSKRYIDPSVNLAEESQSFNHKKWISTW